MRSSLAALMLLTTGLVMTGAGTPAHAENEDTQCRTDREVLIDDERAAQNLTRLGYPEAFEYATGAGVTVAVIDSGVSTKNRHLTKAVSGGTSLVGGSPTTDAHGHGTAVAGIIAARPVKGSVLTGVAPDARIMPVRVYDQQPDTELLAEGIEWAADRGADVINVSIVTPVTEALLPRLKTAVERATRRGALVVAAAGNAANADEPVTEVRLPAAYPGVIGVAATNSSGTVDDYSVHGEHVDVSAPGQNVLTTLLGAGDCLSATDRPYTSWATAYVSGLAAQLRQRFPGEGPEKIANRIMGSAQRPRLEARDDRQGWGAIQPIAALTMSSTQPPGTALERDTSGRQAIASPAERTSDPLDGTRRTYGWWALGALTSAGVAIVLRPLLRSRRIPS